MFWQYGRNSGAKRAPMNAIRLSLLLACFASLAWSGDSDHGPLLTREEGDAIDAIMEQAITRGFPEVRGATWYQPSEQYGLLDARLPSGDWLVSGWDFDKQHHSPTPTMDEAGIWQHAGVQVDEHFPWESLRIEPSAGERLRRASGVGAGRPPNFLSEGPPGMGMEGDTGTRPGRRHIAALRSDRIG